jgi:hypothetical protein
MQSYSSFTKQLFSAFILTLSIGCGNSGGSGNSPGGNNNTPQNKVYSTECSYGLLVDLDSVYRFHKEYEFYGISKADSLIGAFHSMENILPRYSPIACNLQPDVVKEAKLKTAALDDDEIRNYLSQMMNEALLEDTKCKSPQYAKNNNERQACRNIEDFVKDNGWVK